MLYSAIVYKSIHLTFSQIMSSHGNVENHATIKFCVKSLFVAYIFTAFCIQIWKSYIEAVILPYVCVGVVPNLT